MPAQQRSVAAATPASKSSSQRQPDWENYFKNGLPKEIIVIADDSPPPPTPTVHNQNRAAVGGNNTMETAAGSAASSEHVNKKRRMAVNHDHHNLNNMHNPSYSDHTPRYGGSGSDTISADRTTSLHTTAPTSLGSHGSGGSGGSGGASYAEPSTVGQKRKRVTRQDTGTDVKKRRDTGSTTDQYSTYVPPTKPAKKAKDVPVAVIRDVSSLLVIA
jgi:dual-specificity kinase